MKTVSIIVSGKVQGVYYRQSTREVATKLDIKGHVENKPDDTVSIIATGNNEQLQQFINWCHQGPPRAKVAQVEVKELPLQSFDKFVILR